MMAEGMGFDCLWVGDHLKSGYLDGWSLVAAWAAVTHRVRLGVLVSNMIYRNPVLLAEQCSAVDRISNGRLELALGAGELKSDHDVTGVPYWGPRERVSRFAEFVSLVDGVLRGRLSDYRGDYYHATGVELDPRPCQEPRPPLTVAAYGPSAIKVAARYAETWSTFCGGMRLEEQELLAVASLRLRMAERRCEEVGRDPADLRKSVLIAPQHRAWSSVAKFEWILERYTRAGFDELVFYTPEPGESATVDRIAAEVLPLVRQSGSVA
jgi:alkanesulfonate monooxygenase SsuD/methylene tetrahydromethanopterin reductase-like flavin-dependent oxidoreductase (luciferase family)